MTIESAKEYARVAVEHDRQRSGEPTAAEISDVIREITGCPDIKNGEDSLVVALGMLFHRCATTQSSEPDYKQLFEQMCERCDALDAKLAEYSEREPVGYIMPTAIKQLKAGGNAIVGGVSQGCDVPIYTAPQPAESVKLECPKCGADRSKAPCAGELMNCHFKGEAQPAEPVGVPSEDERAAQGLPPYSPRHLTEEEWNRLTESGRRAWGKKPDEPEKEPPCET